MNRALVNDGEVDSHVIADPYRNALSCLKLTTASVGRSEQGA